jgi:light-regulated signal transduction histidine kinase (bacteriophytochrome)
VRAYAHQLEISNKDLEDFAFIVSHDLQEPLRKIQAFGKLLVEQKTYRLGNTAQDYITRMSDAATRMKSMLDDLLNYSRVSTRGQPFSRVSLNKIAEEVLGDLEVRVLETGGSVEVGELPIIEADPMQMRQLIQNLVSNALKFHKPGIRPEVIVCAEWEDGDKSDPNTRVRLIVEDNGIGFEPQFKERIFQPFQRLHGRKEYEGSGIGLAICRKIVERHGGVIEAFGQPGEGAKFIVDLPASQRREAEAIS